MRKTELDVFDVKPTVYPLALIVGAYAEYLSRGIVYSAVMVQVLSAEQLRQMVVADHVRGVSEQEV